MPNSVSSQSNHAPSRAAHRQSRGGQAPQNTGPAKNTGPSKHNGPSNHNGPSKHAGPTKNTRPTPTRATPEHVPNAIDADLSVHSATTEITSFADLGLPRTLVAALARGGIEAPFPIQSATIPDAMAGRDVLGRGQTGSGKTLAFGLPLIARLEKHSAAAKKPRALVLVPTRELAMQVHDTLEPLAHSQGLTLKLVVGGLPYPRQIQALARGVEILVATPGRLADLIEQRACDLSDVGVTVLDEADQMADMGFLPAVTKLLQMTRPGSQRLLFSATLDGGVQVLVNKFLTNPVTHSTAPATASIDLMSHHVLLVAPDDKLAVTSRIAARDGRTIMFVRTKHGADRLAKQLRTQGVPAGSLHGGKTQGARTRTLGAFRDGSVPCLVTTDVAARGIHVDDVGLVVHVDPPADPKDYLHRAGRTARAGESGAVVMLALPHQRREVDVLTRKAGVTAPRVSVTPEGGDLTDLTGAKTPSGHPVEDRTVAPETTRNRPPRQGGQGRGGARSGGRGRPASSGRPTSSGRPASGARRPAPTA